MNRFIFLFIVFLSVIPYSLGQKQQEYGYHPPLKIPLILSSNFGELRPNHFHMGLDFKTNNRIGYRLYSIEDGFVSRIKVSPTGYGKVVYIDHPNGITSVYAHCSEFKGQLDSIVRITQISEQNYAVEIFPKKNEIKVKKGQVIALSGNSGGSTAPHLHFEIRETKTEHALNPLVYGFDIADHKKPEIRGMKVYGLTKDGYQFNKKAVKKTASKGKTNYYISGSSIIIPAHYLSKSGGIGFAFDVIDRFDGASNRCGLYGSILIIDGDTIFGQQTDRVPFESSRYVNSHKDYQEYAHLRRKYHKTFKTRENPLPIYTKQGLGIFKKAKPGGKYKVRYIAYDAKGNRSVLQFDLLILNGKINSKDAIATDSTYLIPSKTKRLTKGTTEVDFGRSTSYEPLKLDASKINYKIGNAETPVQNAYKIKMSLDDVQDGKHYLDITTAKGKHRSINVLYDENLLIFEPKYFGTYKLKRDTIAPRVTPHNFKNATSSLNGKSLQWLIRDIETGIADYDLFINGKWVLLEYDGKKKKITYTRDASFVGKKELLLKVVDDCGNVKVWKKVMVFN
ncbi:MAG: M23 family metallopeptidase [Fluviicola sp.]|nr:M23 family metallopeptidase [Fluviicola sp.]